MGLSGWHPGFLQRLNLSPFANYPDHIIPLKDSRRLWVQYPLIVPFYSNNKPISSFTQTRISYRQPSEFRVFIHYKLVKYNVGDINITGLCICRFFCIKNWFEYCNLNVGSDNADLVKWKNKLSSRR